MQKDSKILDDIAKMATGAAGNLLEMKREMEAAMSHRVENLLQKMQLATKEEFETLHGMISKCRSEQETLLKRLDKLEEKINSLINK